MDENKKDELLRKVKQYKEVLHEMGKHHEMLVHLNQLEDNVLNGHLQALIVSTSFLVAAYAAFGSADSHAVVLRRAVCVAGVSLAVVMSVALQRTARALAWAIEGLDELEEVAGLPYWQRRETKGPHRWIASDFQSTGIPVGMALLWAFLFAETFQTLCYQVLAGICGFCFSRVFKWFVDSNRGI